MEEIMKMKNIIKIAALSGLLIAQVGLGDPINITLINKTPYSGTVGFEPYPSGFCKDYGAINFGPFKTLSQSLSCDIYGTSHQIRVDISSVNGKLQSFIAIPTSTETSNYKEVPLSSDVFNAQTSMTWEITGGQSTSTLNDPGPFTVAPVQ